MSGHRVRADLASVNTARHSRTNGETLADRNEWGAQWLLTSTGPAETRKLAPPSVAGQRIELCFIEDGGDIVVDAPVGQTLDGTGDQATLSAIGQILVLEAFYVAPDDVQWRVTSNIGTVVIA